MTSRRGSNRGWEIRLGALQVVVWLGLAIGGVFGAYFIGFFSGRYVGFETARAASGVDVPKLALSEEYPERSSQSMANVMGKLNNVATLTQETKPVVGAKNEPPEAQVMKPSQPKSEEDHLKTQDGAESKSAAMFDQDAIFNEQLTDDSSDTAASLGSPQREITGKGGDVRVLGGESAAVIGDTTKAAGGDSAATAKAAITDSGKQVPPPSQERSKVSAEQKGPVKDQKKEKLTVVKSLSKGHFAQVGSPKNLAEAEALARNLKRSGFPAIIEETSKGRSPFYRVMVGPEDNKVQASRLVEQIKREPYIKGTVFVRSSK
jgi:cell division septation protein DedD